MAAALMTTLLVGFLFAFLTREHLAYLRVVRVSVIDERRRENPSARQNARVEPACQIPGVPVGWSLDRYSKDGLQQMQVMLTQAARRPGTNQPT